MDGAEEKEKKRREKKERKQRKAAIFEKEYHDVQRRELDSAIEVADKEEVSIRSKRERDQIKALMTMDGAEMNASIDIKRIQRKKKEDKEKKERAIQEERKKERDDLREIEKHKAKKLEQKQRKQAQLIADRRVLLTDRTSQHSYSHRSPFNDTQPKPLSCIREEYPGSVVSTVPLAVFHDIIGLSEVHPSDHKRMESITSISRKIRPNRAVSSLRRGEEHRVGPLRYQSSSPSIDISGSSSQHKKKNLKRAKSNATAGSRRSKGAQSMEIPFSSAGRSGVSSRPGSASSYRSKHSAGSGRVFSSRSGIFKDNSTTIRPPSSQPPLPGDSPSLFVGSGGSAIDKARYDAMQKSDPRKHRGSSRTMHSSMTRHMDKFFK
ncbi:hypothetical protein ADUPG1_012169 [Aduncisulcus paluster]|uniref:Uncharacterized protein n=1 Tax=Aduncisulcus paluster TaxID=2918883 RepID=A0ABQ5K2Q0_9EUKA|nr:hypothetical protein ADUPG1_012169 [Aduncisulcus paluster]